MGTFDLRAVLLSLPVLLLSLTAHEFGHAWVALRQGDDTAYRQGRVTMNPAAHLDWLGTIIFPVMAIGSGMPLLGWARPVPVDPRKFRNYVRGDILVSVAGVAMNALLAVSFAVLLFVLAASTRSMAAPPEALSTLFEMMVIGVVVNVGLILFNLLPIPPLDGSHVMYHLLPPHLRQQYQTLSLYGMIVLWVLVLTGMLRFLFPLILVPARLLMGPAMSIVNPGLLPGV
ncbi:site-2 protease family protein [Longimicrobium sp.]|uniref:site-2 protease family protein n=1 Tax=Longimicrobium sp. TaxID=2029185 RepID=UPI003B3A5225